MPATVLGQASTTTTNTTDAAGQAAGSTSTQAGGSTVDTTTNASGSGSATGNADANGDGVVNAEEQAAATAAGSTTVNATTPAGNVSAGASVTTTTSTSGNAQTGNSGGTGSGNTGGGGTGNTGGGAGSGSGGGGAIVTADTNADGTVSSEERTAAASAAGTTPELTCDDSGPADALDSSATLDPAAVAAVTSVVVVTLSGCDDEDVVASNVAGLQSALATNAGVQAEVDAQVGPGADIVGATLTGGTLIVYVRS
jgi:hypothetical protein